jgi:arylsulfatase A-like enzyme
MTTTARSNVIWIFGDQHRAQALGCAGDPNVFTPNIDRLAGEGLSLDGIGGCPLCSPYRGSLLTSQYPHKAVPGHEHPLPEGMPTVATAFNQAGYHTAYFGKWHVGGWHERDGRAAFAHIARPNRGDFQQWLGYENNNSQWDCWVHGHDAAGREVDRYRLPGYETDALTDLTLDYLRQRAADHQPFFLVLSVQPPHDPYLAPQEWMRRHNPGTVTLRPNVPHVPRILDIARRELAGYYAMIENLDWNVGRVRDALWELGLIENTHLIFFSDHGDMHGSHGQIRKTNPYEESIRVPMILGGTNPRYGGRTGKMNLLVNHVDLGPTSLGLCGIDKPDWMAGFNYAPFRLGGERAANAPEPPDSAYIQLVIPTGHGYSTDRPWRGVVTRDGWKYVCLEGQPWLMFNLNEDPYEQANLAHNTAFNVQRQRLHDRLARWIADTGDRFNLPDITPPPSQLHADRRVVPSA